MLFSSHDSSFRSNLAGQWPSAANADPGALGAGRPKVAYIGGMGRSGTTLIALALAAVPGWVAVGELHWIWERGVVNNELCGCGAHFRECPFWQQVGAEAFGGWDRAKGRELLAERRELLNLRTLPRWYVSRSRGGYERRLAAYAAQVQRLYAAIASVSNCGVIVDSSKTASGAFLLRDGHVEPYLVHVVRDSPGVAFAWSKRVVRPEVTDKITYMGRHTTLRSSVLWVARNLLCHAVEHAGIPRLLVPYESFTADPRRHMERIVRFVAPSTTADLSGFDDREVEVTPMHTVAGNRVRFRHGKLPIRPDEEWKHQMPRAERMLVEAITWPLRQNYGYRSRPPRALAALDPLAGRS